MVFRRVFGEIVKDRLDHRGREFLGGQPVAAADDHGRLAPGCAAVEAMFDQGRHAILVKRFAGRARLLGAVEHGDMARSKWGSAATNRWPSKGR